MAIALTSCAGLDPSDRNDWQGDTGSDQDPLAGADASAGAEAGVDVRDAEVDRDHAGDEPPSGAPPYPSDSDADPRHHELPGACATMAARYEEAVRAAQVCMFPPGAASVCSARVLAKLGCPCETFVNGERVSELQRVDQLAHDWQAEGCDVQRDCAACPPANHGFCKLPTADELPADGLPPEGVRSTCAHDAR